MKRRGCKTVCPWCGKQNDLVTKVMGGRGGPTPGSISLCAVCGELAVFDGRLALRRPTPGEEFAWAMDPTFAPVARARVLARIRADTGGFLVAVVGLTIGADGVASAREVDPGLLDGLLRPRARKDGAP